MNIENAYLKFSHDQEEHLKRLYERGENVTIYQCPICLEKFDEPGRCDFCTEHNGEEVKLEEL